MLVDVDEVEAVLPDLYEVAVAVVEGDLIVVVEKQHIGDVVVKAKLGQPGLGDVGGDDIEWGLARTCPALNGKQGVPVVGAGIARVGPVGFGWAPRGPGALHR